MEKENALNRMKEVLEPYALHDLEDVCERIYLDCQADPMHEATILAIAIEKCREPVGGEDSFGDLTWRIGPHPLGLPHILIEMEHDNERAKFATRFPLTPGQVERDFHADREGDVSNGVVLDYVDEQLDHEDRSDVWGYVCEDAKECVRCQQAAGRIANTPKLQLLLADAIKTNNRRGFSDALDLGADPNSPDEQGDRPLHLAARAGHHRMILPLLHVGARVDEVNKLGQSALHLAAEKACAHGCLVLLAHHANPKLKDHRGHTPIPEPFHGYRYEQSL